ncbi:hypothetical protein ACOSQ3_022356 [Xanthoceras sorbifolium]
MGDGRNWTLEEEDVLISILEEIVANGGRCDTGNFRSGVYKQVVAKIREKIENINITAKHVQNKMKRMKDKYSAAYDMLNTNEFDWDDARKCVTVDSFDILEAYLKKHPNKNYTANRPFPHYERLIIVFGKDRATSNMAKSVADALDQMGLENDEMEASFTQSMAAPSNVASASSAPNSRQTSKRKRKRNVNSAVADITGVFEKGIERASENIAKLTEAITGGDVLTRLRPELDDIGLTTLDVIHVAMYFGKMPNQLHIWKGLADSYKPYFVKAIL